MRTPLSGRILTFLILLLGLVGAGACALSRPQSHPARPSPVDPLRVHSPPWVVGQGITLTLALDPGRAGQSVALKLLAPGPGQQQARAASERYGIAGVQLTWLSPQEQERDIALAAAAGAHSIGLDIDWRRIEPEQDNFAWESLDRVVELAKQYGLVLAPMLLYTPRWASTAPYAPLDYHIAPPTRYQDYRDFVYAVVNRYKPYGESPLTADGYGITDWAIWNEPNTHLSGEPLNPDDFWLGSLEEYLQLLRAGYEGAHAADPGCNVLNGALADIYWAPDRSDLVSALERFYDPNGDGNASDGGRPFFDTLNVHIYQLNTPDPAWYGERLDGIRGVMKRFGDEQKPIWITETGYGSLEGQPLRSPYVSEATQAEAVRMVYETCCADWRVERIFWWSLRDYYLNNSGDNSAMEAHYGLLHANFMPKPAYFAYAQMTRHGSKTLNLSAAVDERGEALVAIPGAFIDQAGVYVVFAQVDAITLASVTFYEASPEPAAP